VDRFVEVASSILRVLTVVFWVAAPLRMRRVSKQSSGRSVRELLKESEFSEEAGHNS
jgi:hypothetical protein